MYRYVLKLLSGAAMMFTVMLPASAQVTEGDDAPLRFGRFEHQGKVVHGFLSVGGIHTLSGGFFEPDTVMTGDVIPLDEVSGPTSRLPENSPIPAGSGASVGQKCHRTIVPTRRLRRCSTG